MLKKEKTPLARSLCCKEENRWLILDAADAEALCLGVDLEEQSIFAFLVLDIFGRFLHDDECSVCSAVFVEFLVAGFRSSGCPVEAHVTHEVAVAVLAASAIAPRHSFVVNSCLSFFAAREAPTGRACLLGAVECVKSSVCCAVGVGFVVAFAVGDSVIDVLCHPELCANLNKGVSLVVTRVGHLETLDDGFLVFGRVDGNAVIAGGTLCNRCCLGGG